MRKAVLVGAVLLCTNVGNLRAQEQPSVDEVCSMFGQLAENIMTSRQDGMAPSKLRKAFAGNQAQSLIYAIIDAAYQRDRYSSDEVKKREIEDFRAMNETTCYKNYKGK